VLNLLKSKLLVNKLCIVTCYVFWMTCCLFDNTAALMFLVPIDIIGILKTS